MIGKHMSRDAKRHLLLKLKSRGLTGEALDAAYVEAISCYDRGFTKGIESVNSTKQKTNESKVAISSRGSKEEARREIGRSLYGSYEQQFKSGADAY